MVWVRRREREGSKECNDRVELYTQRRIERGWCKFWTTGGYTSRTFRDKFRVQLGHLCSTGLHYTSLTRMLGSTLGDGELRFTAWVVSSSEDLNAMLAFNLSRASLYVSSWPG